jgi:hypothetical protein
VNLKSFVCAQYGYITIRESIETIQMPVRERDRGREGGGEREVEGVCVWCLHECVRASVCVCECIYKGMRVRMHIHIVMHIHKYACI